MNLKFRHIVVLMMMMATVLIGSCGRDTTHEEDVTVVPVPGGDPDVESGTPIVFFANQQQDTAVTRAETPLENYQTTFKVWGFKNNSYSDVNDSYGDVQTVFPGYTVKYDAVGKTTTNTSGWDYILSNYPDQSIKFWDWGTRAYRFFGLTGNPTELPSGTAYQFSFPVDTADVEGAPLFTRLWFSTGNPTVYPDRQFGQPVLLAFLKPFAKVRFLFVSADPTVELGELGIVDPSFAPATVGGEIAIRGDFTVSYPLEGTATTETWTVTPGTGSGDSMAALTTAERWYTVLPAANQGAFRLSVTVNNDPDKGCTVPAEFMNWLPSYQYTYIFKVFEEGGVEFGEVKTAFTDWKPGTEADNRYIYNW